MAGPRKNCEKSSVIFSDQPRVPRIGIFLRPMRKPTWIEFTPRYSVRNHGKEQNPSDGGCHTIRRPTARKKAKSGETAGPIQWIGFDETADQYHVFPEATAYLKTLTRPLAVVSVVGLYARNRTC